MSHFYREIVFAGKECPEWRQANDRKPAELCELLPARRLPRFYRSRERRQCNWSKAKWGNVFACLHSGYDVRIIIKCTWKITFRERCANHNKMHLKDNIPGTTCESHIGNMHKTTTWKLWNTSKMHLFYEKRLTGNGSGDILQSALETFPGMLPETFPKKHRDVSETTVTQHTF